MDLQALRRSLSQRPAASHAPKFIETHDLWTRETMLYMSVLKTYSAGQMTSAEALPPSYCPPPAALRAVLWPVAGYLLKPTISYLRV